MKEESKQDIIQDFRDQMKSLGLDEQANTILRNPFNSVENKEARQDILGTVSMDPDSLDMVVQQVSPRPMTKKYIGGLLEDESYRFPYAEGDMVDMEPETHVMPDGTIMPGATHGEGNMDEQMSMLMVPQETEKQDMLPDDEMEDNYLDFIIDEALSEEEEDMLMSKLEQDEELSMLFDKVIEVASEFAGSGPVEGPGTGVSDSIPARLSDGEFVFTAKAVEEIGADNLMAMMKEAEMKADERQGMVTGGPVGEEEEEPVVLQSTQEPVVQKIEVERQTTQDAPRLIQDTGEEELAMSLRRDMRDPSKRYVRS
jgi:hypothetical protein